ncbi:hypothetical protein [Marinivivus vitaminiproducens]|uniref:hypothetical protein n=1 Tax=Marinivivus vitaminiproducens TaxID=3035935 RepID=UPI0027A461CE|nr:hypothetical protein P4R82_15345 [Geminicoccaceae bacterium SCSIO 64248]
MTVPGAAVADPARVADAPWRGGESGAHDPVVGVELYLGDILPPPAPPPRGEWRPEYENLPVPADLPPAAATWLGGLAPVSSARIDGR